MSVTALDVGFDLRVQGMPVDLSEKTEPLSCSYHALSGNVATIQGSKETIAIMLAQNGYSVIAAHTPNGREIRATKDGKFEVQPENDNYWVACDSVKDALRIFRGETKRPGTYRFEFGEVNLNLLVEQRDALYNLISRARTVSEVKDEIDGVIEMMDAMIDHIDGWDPSQGPEPEEE